MSWKSQIFASLIVITRKRHLYLCTIVSKQSKRNRKSYQMNKSIKINFMFARSQTVEFISVPKVSIILCASCTVARSEGAQCWAIWSKKRWYFWILCTGFIRYEESERGCPLTNFKCSNRQKEVIWALEGEENIAHAKCKHTPNITCKISQVWYFDIIKSDKLIKYGRI